MTDEEMAEEYANKNVPVDTFGYRSLDDVHYDVKQAYLAGLRAGRPQWHKVADGDLPKNEYEGKCLAQKIQYIKELQEENAELKELLTRWVSDKPYTVSEQKDLISDTEQYLKGKI